MDMILQLQLQECLEQCSRIEELLQEHRQETDHCMGGQLQEAYAKALLQAEDMTDELKACIRELYNSLTVM